MFEFKSSLMTIVIKMFQSQIYSSLFSNTYLICKQIAFQKQFTKLVVWNFWGNYGNNIANSGFTPQTLLQSPHRAVALLTEIIKKQSIIGIGKSFISARLRTMAWETVPQIILRNCLEKHDFYILYVSKQKSM